MSLGLAFWFRLKSTGNVALLVFIILLTFFYKARGRFVIVHYCAFTKLERNMYVLRLRWTLLLTSTLMTEHPSSHTILTWMPRLTPAPAWLSPLAFQSRLDLHGFLVHPWSHSHQMESNLFVSDSTHKQATWKTPMPPLTERPSSCFMKDSTVKAKII